MANFIPSDKFRNYYSSHQITESRLERLKSQNKTEATHLGLWDKFKDLFLTNKKQEALNALYDAIHGSSATEKLEAFSVLKSCAGQAYQDRFSKEVDDDGIISFLIDKDVLSSCSVKEALYIDDNVTLLPMTADEKGLFIRMLDVVKEKDQTIVDAEKNMVGARREAVRQEIGNEFYALYRPAEESTRPSVEWRGSEIKGSLEILECLNMGNMKPHTLFNKVGYQYNPIMKSVEFRMVHPAISFLLGQYVNADEMAEKFYEEKEDIMLKSSSYLTLFNEDYEKYQTIKPKIDNILRETYVAHGGTLCIEDGGECRNYLGLQPPSMATEIPG